MTEVDALADASFVVEAILEEEGAKVQTYRRLAAALAPDGILTSSTSSLSISRLAEASGRPDRFAGFHVFNPVERMKLVELVFPPAAARRPARGPGGSPRRSARPASRCRTRRGSWSTACSFPTSSTRCGARAGRPRPERHRRLHALRSRSSARPLVLLDLVGIDVSIAIGESIGAAVPERLYRMAEEGKLGRKVKAGFLEY